MGRHFAVGDDVRIIGNTKPHHYLAIGSVGTIVRPARGSGSYPVCGLRGEDGLVVEQLVNPYDLELVRYEDIRQEFLRLIGVDDA